MLSHLKALANSAREQVYSQMVTIEIRASDGFECD